MRVTRSSARPNIPLSALSPSPIVDMNTHTKYIPPHPQKGTRYHRYTVLLFPQKASISVPVFSNDQRLGFSVRDFIATYDLDLSAGGGIFMWREVWDHAVSTIYRDILGKSRLLNWMASVLIYWQAWRSPGMASHPSWTGMRGQRLETNTSSRLHTYLACADNRSKFPIGVLHNDLRRRTFLEVFFSIMNRIWRCQGYQTK